MLDAFLDCFGELLTLLNFRAGFAEIRKKVENPFLRGILYTVSAMGVLLFAALFALGITGIFALAEYLLR